MKKIKKIFKKKFCQKLVLYKKNYSIFSFRICYNCLHDGNPKVSRFIVSFDSAALSPWGWFLCNDLQCDNFIISKSFLLHLVAFRIKN